MKLLLDECLPRRIKNHLKEFDVFTVGEKGWSSLKNVNLLKAAIADNFDILLTVNKKLKYEQNIKLFDIAIVVFDVIRNKEEDIIPLLSNFKSQINKFEKRKIYLI